MVVGESSDLYTGVSGIWEFIIDRWKLTSPPLIVSVTGEDDKDISNKYQQVIRSIAVDLVNAAAVEGTTL